jgi:hypothetical protein
MINQSILQLFHPKQFTSSEKKTPVYSSNLEIAASNFFLVVNFTYEVGRRLLSLTRS